MNYTQKKMIECDNDFIMLIGLFTCMKKLGFTIFLLGIKVISFCTSFLTFILVYNDFH